MFLTLVSIKHLGIIVKPFVNIANIFNYKITGGNFNSKMYYSPCLYYISYKCL